MRISCKQTIALVLTLVLLLTLCACAQERQTEPEKAINNAAGDVPQTKTGARTPDKLPEEPAPLQRRRTGGFRDGIQTDGADADRIRLCADPVCAPGTSGHSCR